uniref:Uncharacterized protein n=1 Tax=Acrobeloides nanus TaxID=290746 RepID=A0A914C945_9BILA
MTYESSIQFCLHEKEFVALNGYWGLSSEQPIESLYHFINDDLHQLSAIKDEETLYNQLVKFQWLRKYYIDKTELKKKDKAKTMTGKESTSDDDSDFSVEL